jgi:hypothetical protein
LAEFDEALAELDLLESRFPGGGVVADTAVVLKEQILAPSRTFPTIVGMFV